MTERHVVASVGGVGVDAGNLQVCALLWCPTRACRDAPETPLRTPPSPLPPPPPLPPQCRGVFRFIAALLHGKAVLKPEYSTKADPALRFHHRFAAFAPVAVPQHLTWDMFLESSDYSDYQAEHLYQARGGGC